MGIFHKYFYLFIFLGIVLSAFATFIKPSLINGISLTLLLIGLLVQILASLNKTRNFGIVVDRQGKPSAFVPIDLYRWNGKAWDIYTRGSSDSHGRYILTPEDGYYFMRLLSSTKQILAEKQFTINNSYPAIREKFVLPL